MTTANTTSVTSQVVETVASDKKVRKPRSDKGVKRGAYKPRSAKTS